MKKNNLKFIITAVCCLVLILSILYVALTSSKRTYSACSSEDLTAPNGYCCESVGSGQVPGTTEGYNDATASLYASTYNNKLYNGNYYYNCSTMGTPRKYTCTKIYYNCTSTSGDGNATGGNNGGGTTSNPDPDSTNCSRKTFGEYVRVLNENNQCVCAHTSGNDTTASWSGTEYTCPTTYNPGGTTGENTNACSISGSTSFTVDINKTQVITWTVSNVDSMDNYDIVKGGALTNLYEVSKNGNKIIISFLGFSNAGNYPLTVTLQHKSDTSKNCSRTITGIVNGSSGGSSYTEPSGTCTIRGSDAVTGGERAEYTVTPNLTGSNSGQTVASCSGDSNTTVSSTNSSSCTMIFNKNTTSTSQAMSVTVRLSNGKTQTCTKYVYLASADSSKCNVTISGRKNLSTDSSDSYTAVVERPSGVTGTTVYKWSATGSGLASISNSTLSSTRISTSSTNNSTITLRVEISFSGTTGKTCSAEIPINVNDSATESQCWFCNNGLWYWVPTTTSPSNAAASAGLGSAYTCSYPSTDPNINSKTSCLAQNSNKCIATFYDTSGYVFKMLTSSFTNNSTKCEVSAPTYGGCPSNTTFKGWVTDPDKCSSSATVVKSGEKLSFTTSSRTTDRYACCVTSSGGGYTPTNNGGNNGGSNSNPNTGPTLIYIVWSIGLLMIGYSIWYFKKGIKE